MSQSQPAEANPGNSNTMASSSHHSQDLPQENPHDHSPEPKEQDAQMTEAEVEVEAEAATASATAPASSQLADVDHVKSPSPLAPATTHSSRPASKSSSFKQVVGKGGFLSFLLCCTSGASSYFESSNKHTTTAGRKANRQSQSSSATDGTTSRITEKNSNTPFASKEKERNVVLPTIVTDQTELSNLHAETGRDTDAGERSTPGTPDSGLMFTPQRPTAPLLPPLAQEHKGRKCLVLDLDETLIHSSFKLISNPDFVVPVEIEDQYHNVYVLKRPGVDEFMRKMGQIYEVVIFTASLSKYADPVLDKLDIHKVAKHRLFRESCFNREGTYVKDLSQLGRDLPSTLILDNSPASYIFHNSNAVPVSTWFNDPHDTELTDLVPFLEDLATVDDVTMILDVNLKSNLN